MKIIQYVDGVVVDIINAREDALSSNITVVEEIPAHTPRKGYNSILKYGDSGLYWDYEEAPVSDEISAERALNIITGG